MSRTLGPDDMVLCAGTVAHGDFATKVAAASAAGFDGLSFFLSDYTTARAGGRSDAELRGMLDDHGLGVAELDVLLSWVPGSAAPAGEEGATLGAGNEDDFFRAADALGARSLNAAVFVEGGLDMDALADAFAGLCERAAAHELLVHLEFIPFSPVRDLGVALSLVERSGPNGGVMLDTWHLFRSGGSTRSLRAAPGARILAVQLNDAPAEAEANPVEETLHRRLLPGRGAIDLPGVISALRAIGSPAPLGVEVFSDDLHALPAEEAARRAIEATRAVLAESEGA